VAAIEKTYLSADEFLSDVWSLAARIVRSGWKPDLLVALWRGGAPVGVGVHEFLKTVGWDLRHIAVKCASYDGIGENGGEVRFDGCEEVFARIGAGEKILVVDDVFDTGKTALAVRKRLESAGAEMRIATVYWKVDNNRTALSPDYFVRRCSDDWIVFPHEMEGLSDEELARKDPKLAALITALR
jgi:hypoxanthine phosphoribosyltransferase